MAVVDHRPSEEPGPDTDLRAVGERIESLLDASAAHGPVARERSEELVRLVTDLYGAGMERMLDILYDAGRLDSVALDALAGDDLVASLLMVHGLHPHDVSTRVERALEDVRPYLGSHGGDVELVGISEEGLVKLRLLGSCDGCASSSVTLKLAVEGAVEAAAPEVTGIEVDAAPSSGPEGSFIPVSSLRTRLADGPGAAWQTLPGMADLAAGEVRGCSVAGVPVVVMTVGTDLYAYRDECARCGAGLAGTVLQRRLGGAAGDAVLRCPGCRAHYAVREAGECIDADGHLEPLPLLVSDGEVSVAVPAAGTVSA